MNIGITSVRAISLLLIGISLILSGCSEDITSSNSVSNVSKLRKISDAPDEDSWSHIQFINEQLGWLGTGKKLWRTTDGGRSWEKLYSVDNPRDLLNSIKKVEFINSQTGWMLLSPGSLLKTDDGGLTWKHQENTPLGKTKGELNDVVFMKDGRTGWIAGGMPMPNYQANPGKYFRSAKNYETTIFRTDNGGQSWVREFASAHGGQIDGLFILDDGHVWAFGEAGFFYREMNKGRWELADYLKGDCNKQMLLHTTQTGREGGDIFEPVATFFLDTKQGWLSFKNGYIAKTTDGGRTWCDLLNPSVVWPKPSYDTFFLKIHFTDSMHGWGLSAEGYVYETNDGGASWVRIDMNIKAEDIYILESCCGWIVAKEGLFKIGP